MSKFVVGGISRRLWAEDTFMLPTISAQVRSHKGKEFCKKTRLKGVIPAVIYGKDTDNKTLEVNLKDLEKLLRSKMGLNTFFELQVEGDKKYTAIIREYQGDVLTRKFTHVDFWSVDKDQEVLVSVAVKLIGKAPGLKQGGIMDQVSYNLKLLCKAGSIPEVIEVDVGGLDVEQSIHVADIKLPEGVKTQRGYNPTIVAMISEKRALAALAKLEEAAAASAAPAEGAAPAVDADGKPIAAAPAVGPDGKPVAAAAPAVGADGKPVAAAAPAKGGDKAATGKDKAGGKDKK